MNNRSAESEVNEGGVQAGRSELDREMEMDSPSKVETNASGSGSELSSSMW